MSILTSPNITQYAHRGAKPVLAVMNLVVLVLSVMLIVYMSIETFEKKDFLLDRAYMRFQFWVCVVFMVDFFIGLYFARDKWRFTRRHIVFLLLSIPYLNIIDATGIELSYDAMYFIRFIPLARGALAMSIVSAYLSGNAVTSIFLAYIVILLMLSYFCSLIFYQREMYVNPAVDTYWTALWWTAMNMCTVGCDISPVTVAGKIVAVVLPVAGMVVFPLFTVYLTDYVTRTVTKLRGQSITPQQSDNAKKD